MENQTKGFADMIYTAFLWIFALGGLGVWVGCYLPALFLCGNECTYMIARHLFFTNRILLTASGFCLGLLIFKKYLSKYDYFGIFGLATLLTWGDGFHFIHSLFSQYQLYPFWLKTSPDGKSVVSFQYARVYLLIFLAGGFYLSMLRKPFRTFERILWAWFFVALCVFMFSMHRVVGRIAFFSYQQEVNTQIERTVSTHPAIRAAQCENLGFSCFLIDSEEAFAHSTPKIKNRLNPTKDSKDSIDDFVNKSIIATLKKETYGKPLVISEDKISQNNIIRATAFAGIKDPDGKLFILIDYNKTSYALDVFLILFSILMAGFVLVWVWGGLKIYQYHAKFKLH
jgi:hypothetical protein